MSYENFITKIHKPIIWQMRIDINIFANSTYCASQSNYTTNIDKRYTKSLSMSQSND
jgi:hypothetical protein